MEKEKAFNLPACGLKTFYKRYLDLIQPFTKINKRDCDILSEILVLNYEKRDIPMEDRMSIILSRKSRKVLEDKLHITDQVVRYSIHNLKKAKIITDKGLSPVVSPIPGENFSLSFNFTIDTTDAKES